VEPEASVEPDTLVEADALVEPEAPVEPDTPVDPDAPMEAEALVEPDAAMDPDISVEPDTAVQLEEELQQLSVDSELEENPPPLTRCQKMMYVAVSICSVLYLNMVYCFVFTPCRPDGLLIKYPQFLDVLQRFGSSTP